MGELLSSLNLYPLQDRGTGSDANSCTEMGTYLVSGSIYNGPSGEDSATLFGLLSVFKSNTRILQILNDTNYSNPTLYIRTGENNNWRKWKKVSLLDV